MCSTPFGITENCGVGVYLIWMPLTSAQRLSASLKIAGLTVFHRFGFLKGAQRLSASLKIAGSSRAVSECESSVLNAFRHH